MTRRQLTSRAGAALLALASGRAVGAQTAGAQTVAAQTAADTAQQAAQQTARRREVTTTVLREPSLLAPLRAPAPVIRFAATQDDQTVAAQFGTYLRAARHTDAAVALTLSGPLNTSGKETPLADLDGLRTSTSASLSATFVRWNPRFRPDASGRPAVRAVCADYRATLPAAEQARFVCAESQIRSAVYLARYRAAARFGTPWFGTVRATLGQLGFDYVDETTLAAASVRRTARQAEVGLGRMLSTGGLADLVYRYERAYLPGTSEQLCTPIGTTGALGCQDAVIGAPTERTRSVLSFEVRQYATRTLGFAPTVRRDLRHAVTAVELPIYFLQDQAGGLASGVRVGYRSDTRRVTLVAFIAEFAAPFTR